MRHVVGLSGVSRRRLCAIESGDRSKPQLRSLEALATTYDLPLWKIVRYYERGSK